MPAATNGILYKITHALPYTRFAYVALRPSEIYGFAASTSLAFAVPSLLMIWYVKL
jgi:hypothetical protein